MPIGRPLSQTPNVATKVVSTTATGVTTDFTVTGGYRIGHLGVYLNGIRLVDATDYTARDGSSVGLTTAAVNGDSLQFHVFDSFNVANTIKPNESEQTINGKLTVNELDIAGGPSFTGITTLSNTTASTSTSTGALIVSGGVGIAKSVFIGEGISVEGTITYNDVTNVDAVGIVTAGKGVRVTTGGITMIGVATMGAVGASGTTLHVHGDGRFTGVLTATSFSGSGANLTGITTAAVPGITTQLHSVFSTINASGIVTAATMSGTDYTGNFILDSYLFN